MKLHSHKFIICPFSTTLDSMLSERWTKPNEPVKIDGYSFDDFKEFLTFIYSGKCKLTNENIFSMVDTAEFFDVYKWAENRVMKLQKTVESEEICEKIINVEIKNEMLQFLPFFNFEKMDYKFFNDFIAQKSFIFTNDEFDKILKKRIIHVKVTDGRGKSMNGKFHGGQIENIDDVIQSVRSDHLSYLIDLKPGECPIMRWAIFPMQPKLTMPSKLIKNDNIEFYIVLSDNGEYGHISLKKRRDLQDGDYLLAEMFPEDGFDYRICFNHKIAFFRDV
uniref:BTB domain-containing protein n=1 Tax=Panagrolaimus davidi TaxID=227884 RepID=A0A914Q434_9BILA